MLNLEIDGRKVAVAPGSTVMDAANALDIYVPHFCYHKKLSIAANCRMCLVQVEKAPKPLPACATPAAEGMKAFTHSETAVNAQKSVMEFLLINHPLDCPICDQGGECQLQDLAVGYGGSSSRYGEPKRVVFHKDLGPLVSAEEMARCIQCTRCVRFGQEIAGIMELGMIGRGEHSEIVSFVGKTVDSELSGNSIDVCPVGALTSKPFRYAARTWELARRKSVAPHDSLGSNLVVQVKGDRVMRVLPLENEAVNECWISDKDRFSYEALNSPERLTTPMVKQAGEWKEVDWQTALDVVARGVAKRLRRQRADRTDVDRIARELGVHGLADERHDFRVLAAADHSELHDPGDFLSEAHAPRALDAAGHLLGGDERAQVLVEHDALGLGVPRRRAAVADRQVLQLTFAALVADRAVERVVDEQELHHALLRGDRLLGGRPDLHAFGDGRRARRQRLGRLLDLHEAHPAVRSDGELLVVAEMRHVDAERMRRLDHRAAGGDLKRLAVDFDVQHGFRSSTTKDTRSTKKGQSSNSRYLS